MNILIVVGAVINTNGGVWDYTRKLSQELTRQGHSIFIAAIHDPRVTHITYCHESRIIRIPMSLSWRKKRGVLLELIKKENIDWTSLQFVPYSFSKKGIPIGIINTAEAVRKKCNLHIMYHELSIGRTNALSKNFLIYNIQKKIIKEISKQANVIHTHLPKYLDELNSQKINAKKLPLFSNISNCYHRLASISYEEIFNIAIFSRFDLPSSSVRFLKNLIQDLQAQFKKINFVFIGEINIRQANPWIQEFSDIVNLEFCGRLDEHQVSRLLNECNAGYSPVPRHALGKSGSVFAMLEHRLPIIAPEIGDLTSVSFLDVDLNKAIVIEPKLINVFSATSFLKDLKLENPSLIAERMIYDLTA